MAELKAPVWDEAQWEKDNNNPDFKSFDEIKDKLATVKQALEQFKPTLELLSDPAYEQTSALSRALLEKYLANPNKADLPVDGLSALLDKVKDPAKVKAVANVIENALKSDPTLGQALVDNFNGDLKSSLTAVMSNNPEKIPALIALGSNPVITEFLNDNKSTETPPVALNTSASPSTQTSVPASSPVATNITPLTTNAPPVATNPAPLAANPIATKGAIPSSPKMSPELATALGDILGEKKADPSATFQTLITKSNNPGKTLEEISTLLSNPALVSQLPENLKPLATILADSKLESGVLGAALAGKPLAEPLKKYLADGGSIQKLSELAKNPDLAAFVPSDKKQVLDQFAKLDPKFFPIAEAVIKGDQTLGTEISKLVENRLKTLEEAKGSPLTVGDLEDLVKSAAPKEARDAFYAQVNQTALKVISDKKLVPEKGVTFDLQNTSSFRYKVTSNTPASEDVTIDKGSEKVTILKKGDAIGDFGVAVAQTEIRETEIDGVKAKVEHGVVDIGQIVRNKPLTPEDMAQIMPKLQESLAANGAGLGNISKDQLVALGIPAAQAASFSSLLGSDKAEPAQLVDRAAFNPQLTQLNKQIAALKQKYPALAGQLDQASSSLNMLVGDPNLTQDQAMQAAKDLRGTLANLAQSEELSKEVAENKKKSGNTPLFDFMNSALALCAGFLNLIALLVPSFKPLAESFAKAGTAFQDGTMDKLALLDGDGHLSQKDLDIAKQRKILTENEANLLGWAVKAEPVVPILAPMVKNMSNGVQKAGSIVGAG